LSWLVVVAQLDKAAALVALVVYWCNHLEQSVLALIQLQSAAVARALLAIRLMDQLEQIQLLIQ
jgi:hypothetical protein